MSCGSAKKAVSNGSKSPVIKIAVVVGLSPTRSSHEYAQSIYYFHFSILSLSLSLSTQTFHTPSLGDEEFEIPSIPLEPDSALSSSHHGVSHFGDPSPDDGVVVPGNAVVGGDDPSFASTYVNTPSQGLEHLSLGGISQPGGGALLGSSLGMVRIRPSIKLY